MDEHLNIVNLIENNTTLQLSPEYNNRFINKIKEVFTETQQQLFVSSFYCYLNYNQTTDFVIDLDNIWKWLGFSQKAMAKHSLQKNFIIDKDYKVLLNLQVKKSNENNTRGGHNKETILLTIHTFELFCIKVKTKKANEIHEYFFKLKEIMNEIIKEECLELKQKLENQKISNQLEKELLREKTLLEQFPVNTQCVYYGIIDNTNDDNEQLVKYGNSNNLQQRVEQHKKIYTNFRLVNAFKVENKLHIENSIKNCPEIMPYKRAIEIKNTNYTELLAVNALTFDKLDKIIQNIIKSIEYSPENYVKLLCENRQLKDEIVTLKQVIKKLNQRDNKNALLEEEKDGTDTHIRKRARKIQKQKDNFYYINDKKYEKLIGTRQEVWDDIAYKTAGELTKEELVINKNGEVVSKIKSEQSSNDIRGICKKRKEENEKLLNLELEQLKSIVNQSTSSD
jgi:hypothetical protein